MNLKSFIAIGLGMLTIASIQSPAQAASRTAKAIVTNQTGQRMVYVTLVHKYSNNYKNNETWANLPSGSGTTASPLTVQYNTGFGTTGKDWWMVSWKSSDGRTCVTNPNNFRGAFDKVEGFLLGNAGKAGEKLGALLGEKAGTAAGAKVGGPPGGVVGGVVGKEVGGQAGEAAANELADALFNSESTVGFKQHILRSDDDGQIVNISLYDNGQAKIQSPSGVSDTVYKCSASTPNPTNESGTTSFNFENRSEGWWFAGNAGIDDGKNLEHNGRSNGWVRNSSGWNAVNNKANVKPNSQCTAAAWLRTSDTLTDGYMSVRSFKPDGGAGNVISELKLAGAGSPNPQNRNYNRYTFNFNSGSNNTVLFYVGLNGNGKDSWIQADDVDISCQ